MARGSHAHTYMSQGTPSHPESRAVEDVGLKSALDYWTMRGTCEDYSQVEGGGRWFGGSHLRNLPLRSGVDVAEIGGA